MSSGSKSAAVASGASRSAASALAHLRRIVHAIHQQSAAIESAVGITGPQLWALRELESRPEGLPLGELSQRLAVHKATGGRVAERLVAKGLVRCVREKRDKRVVLVSLTAKGRKIAARPVSGPAQADLLARLEALPPRELAQVDRALARVEALLGAEGLAPAPLFEDRPARLK